VGTKRQAQEAVAEEAANAGQFYVNQRWLGGLLTNFNTIQQRLRRLEELERMRDTGELATLPKKEQLKLTDEYTKLQKILGGIRGMKRLPDVLFVIDTRKEHIAIHEAQRLDIPIVALLDTNSDPDEVDYPIPANDDAIRAVRLLSSKIAEAAQRGATERASTLAKEEAEEGFEPSEFEEYTFEPEGYEASLDADGESALAEEAEARAAEDADEAAAPPGSGESDPVSETVSEEAPAVATPAASAEEPPLQDNTPESDVALSEAAAAETNPA
jgi:small subunit ribosomal protein S2